MRVQRDHYEGSAFDLTQGLAAGPYGDPNRWDSAPVDNLTRADVLQGSFERAISMFRTSYSIVAVARAAVPDQLALVWICQYAPSSSSYAPFYVAADAVPAPYSRWCSRPRLHCCSPSLPLSPSSLGAPCAVARR